MPARETLAKEVEADAEEAVATTIVEPVADDEVAVTVRGKTVGFLVVRTVRRGTSRRRAGRAFTDAEVTIPLTDLSPAEIVAITGDNLLTATFVDKVD
ncbi:hypothetical protein [Nitrobacter winogradskyi]|nr:hypothetical protein [Nitrobacter winogradskyi]